MRVDMCPESCTDICIDMCKDMCIDLCKIYCDDEVNLESTVDEVDEARLLVYLRVLQVEPPDLSATSVEHGKTFVSVRNIADVVEGRRELPSQPTFVDMCIDMCRDMCIDNVADVVD